MTPDIKFVAPEGAALEMAAWQGEGTPILLLHEGLGSVAMWKDFPERLAAATGHPVIAWSRRGYGRSDALPFSHNPDYMHLEASSVPPLMDAIDLKKAVLLGHSDGGSIALLVASQFPDRVAGLILEAPHVHVEQLTYDSIAAVKDAYHTTNLARKLARYHDNVDEVFWRWNDIWLDPRFRDWSIEECLPHIRAPMLLIQGRDDEYGTMDQLDRIQTVCAAARVELDACGHSPHRDQTDRVLQASNIFMKAHRL